MSVSFPGLKATLHHSKQTTFKDAKDSYYLSAIHRFYNRNADPQSLINRVEVWEGHLGICLLDIYFNQIGCKAIENAYSNALNARLFHHHDHHWCKLQVLKPISMRSLLQILEKTQGFSDEQSHECMQELLKKLPSAL